MKQEKPQPNAEVEQTLSQPTANVGKNTTLQSNVGYKLAHLYAMTAIAESEKKERERDEMKTIVAIVMASVASYTRPVETLCDELRTALGNKWEKLEETLSKTFDKQGSRTITVPKEESESILGELCTEVDDCLPAAASAAVRTSLFHANLRGQRANPPPPPPNLNV